MLTDMTNFIVEMVGTLGYMGIFFMMFLESSFVPFPSEVVMIPAGYLVYKGEMNAGAAIFAGVSGSLFGALFNYYLALKFGRQFLIKYGKYVFIKEETVFKMENYFEKHGPISTFAGRLIPAVRQYISFPAGIAKMNLIKFSLYTSLGACIWVVILTLLGYYIGENQELIHEYLRYIILSILFLLAVGGYLYYRKNKKATHV
ncbi:MAG: DedA family protein [Campylobacteraceae bacterium]|nr:DedA family protein [Campylobacteraceae bacterium]